MFTKLNGGVRVSFHTRSLNQQGTVMLYARLSYDGHRTNEYRAGICVLVECWNRQTKSLYPNSPQADTIRLQQSRFVAEHESIRIGMELQLGTGNVTAEMIKQRWRNENDPALKRKPRLNTPDSTLTLIATYEGFLVYLDNQPKSERIALKTRNSYQKTGQHLLSFLKKRNELEFLAEKVTPGFGMQFYDYLRSQDMGADTANRYLNYLKAALSHALLYDRIRTNGLFQFQPPKGGKAKRIVFIGKPALFELEAMPLTGIRDTVRKWVLFMCHTGLDYNDAVKIVANDSTYRSSDKWVYQRLKMRHAPDWGECHIPILDTAERLITELKGSKAPLLKVINVHSKELGQKLRLPFELSSKVCRKTAGVVFLNEGYSMQSIQKILGHQSLAMTERHYVSIQGFVVDKDMAKIQSSRTSASVSLSHIHKAS